MMDWNGHMTSAGWFFSIVAILIIVALAGAAIVWITRELGTGRDGGPPAVIPTKEILDRRLASGEINSKQYEQLRETLEERREPVRAGR